MRQITMKDIAEFCDVSTKTVSRVINNSSDVKPETRDRILKAMQECNYQANLLARGLKNKKTNTIIVFIDKHREKYWGQWHSKMLFHLFKEAKRKGFKIIVSPSSAKGHINDETDGFHLLASRMADGAIILDNAEDDIRLDFFNKQKVPYVLIGQTEDKESNWVDLDNHSVGTMGCQYLVDKGYKKIALMLGQDQFQVNQIRANGFIEVAKERGIDYRIDYNVDSIDAVYQKTLEVCGQNHCDALFISGSERAVGAYRALNELGLQIPQDVAIMGIDNIALCEYLYPSMTVIDQNCDILATNILDMLYDLINDTKSDRKRQLLVQNKIIEREST